MEEVGRRGWMGQSGEKDRNGKWKMLYGIEWCQWMDNSDLS